MGTDAVVEDKIFSESQSKEPKIMDNIKILSYELILTLHPPPAPHPAEDRICPGVMIHQTSRSKMYRNFFNIDSAPKPPSKSLLYE